ncbi:hypothetical protein Tco_1434468 [Tanacetum coccineum]
MPSRKWLATDKKGVGIMVDLIDKLMLVRRITRNLERLVGARELDMDYKLMQRADTMQALKASKKLSKSQPHVRGSYEGTGASSGVPDESTVIFTTLSEGTSTKPGVPDETNDDEESNDKFVYGNEYVHDDVDEEMNNAEDNETEKDDEEITDA